MLPLVRNQFRNGVAWTLVLMWCVMLAAPHNVGAANEEPIANESPTAAAEIKAWPSASWKNLPYRPIPKPGNQPKQPSGNWPLRPRPVRAAPPPSWQNWETNKPVE